MSSMLIARIDHALEYNGGQVTSTRRSQTGHAHPSAPGSGVATSFIVCLCKPPPPPLLVALEGLQLNPPSTRADETPGRSTPYLRWTRRALAARSASTGRSKADRTAPHRDRGRGRSAAQTNSRRGNVPDVHLEDFAVVEHRHGPAQNQEDVGTVPFREGHVARAVGWRFYKP
ncbi:hypothetical protein ACFYTC_35665 [Actinomadura nitritigenes]|uniref:hypothetical protein n=1 Tax=Actinomadura nitritigenes TaxID=134602 RepID=UPI0036A33793